MIDFSKVPSVYWSKDVQMSYLQRRIIVFSITYYENGYSIVSDAEFDEICFQLVDMMKRYSSDAEKTTYWYAMSDFDGSTGFDIVSKLTRKDKKYLREIARAVQIEHAKKRRNQ